MHLDVSDGSSSSAIDAVLQAKRLLVLLPGYSAPGESEPFADATILGNTFARLLTKVRRSAMRHHVRFYRDFYANPRSPHYMAERLRALFENGDGKRRMLVFDPLLDIDPGAAGWANEIRRCDEKLARTPRDLPDLLRNHDTVLLVHSDALGLGLGSLERSLVAAFPGNTFVLNGRRRLYRLDRRMRRRLRRRRLFAETRIVEAVFARLAPIAGWVLARLDWLTSHTPS